MVSETPSAFLDSYLMVGGVVIAVEESDEGSILELMEWRINRRGEPMALEDQGRRLLVKSDQRLDPLKYQSGRLVTFTGTVLGSETRTLGEHPYRYPIFTLDA